MTGNELVTLVRSEILEPSAGFWTDAEMLSWINQGEKDFISRIHGMQGIAQIDTIAGRADYPLPANWLSIRALFINDDSNGQDSWKRIHPSNLEKFSQERPNFLNSQTELRGVPNRYMIWDKTIYLDPIPKDSDKEMKMFYEKKAVPLTSLSDSLNVDDTLSDGIKAYVLWKAWSKEKELDLASDQRNMYFDYVGQGRRWIKKQSGDQAYIVDVRSNVPFSQGGTNGNGPLDL